jgi:hypothetical protein
VPLILVLAEFKVCISQCESLIVSAHRTDANGSSLFALLDQQQITIAAFLNLFIAWEKFLETSLTNLMIGEATLSGTPPVRYVSPQTLDAAREMVIGVMRYFDYANHDNMRKMVKLYFERGYPYEPHLSAILSDLADLRTMRNASAHITSTTQTPLESLAMRISGRPMPGIDLYQLLTMIDPQSATGGTVFETYKNKLIVTAELIAQG